MKFPFTFPLLRLSHSNSLCPSPSPRPHPFHFPFSFSFSFSSSSWSSFSSHSSRTLPNSSDRHSHLHLRPHVHPQLHSQIHHNSNSKRSFPSIHIPLSIQLSPSTSGPKDPKNDNDYNNSKNESDDDDQNNIPSESSSLSSDSDVSDSPQFQLLLSEFNKMTFSPLPASVYQKDKFVSPMKEFLQNIPKMSREQENILRGRGKGRGLGRGEITIQTPSDSPSPSPSPSSSSPSVSISILSNSDLISCWWYCFQFLGGRESTPHDPSSPFHSIYKKIMMSPLFSITFARMMEHEIHDHPSQSLSPQRNPMEFISFCLLSKKFHFPQTYSFIQIGWKHIVREILPNGIPESLKEREKEMEEQTRRKTRTPSSVSSLYSSTPPPLSSLPFPPLYFPFKDFITSSSPPLSPLAFSEFLDILVLSLMTTNDFVNEKFKSNSRLSPHLFEGIFHYLLLNYTSLPNLSDQYVCVTLVFRNLIRLCQFPQFRHLYLSFWPHFVPIFTSFPNFQFRAHPSLLVYNLYALLSDPLIITLSFEHRRSFQLLVQPLTTRFIAALTSPWLLSTWKGKGKEGNDFFISVRYDLFFVYQQVIRYKLMSGFALPKFTVDTLLPLVHSIHQRKLPPYDDINTYWNDLSLCLKVIQRGSTLLPYLSLLSLICDMSDLCQSSPISLPSKVLFPLSRIMSLIGVTSESIQNHFLEATRQWISDGSDRRRRELNDIISFLPSYGENLTLSMAYVSSLISMVQKRVRHVTHSLQKVLRDSSSKPDIPIHKYEEYLIFHRFLWSSLTFALLCRHVPPTSSSPSLSRRSLLIDILQVSWSPLQHILTHTPDQNIDTEFIQSLRNLRRFIDYATGSPTIRDDFPSIEILWTEKMEKMFTKNSRDTERKNGGKLEMERFIPTMRGALEKVKMKVEGKGDKEHKEMGIHMNIISLLDNPTGNSDFDCSLLFIPFKVEFTWKHQKHSDIPISNSAPTHTPHVTPTSIASANPSPFFSFYLCLLGTHDHLYDCHKALDVEIKVREEKESKNSSSSSPSPSPSDSISKSESDSVIDSFVSSTVSDVIHSLSPSGMRNSTKVELLILRNLIHRQNYGSIDLFVLPPHQVSALKSEENCESTAKQINLLAEKHIQRMWGKQNQIQRQKRGNGQDKDKGKGDKQK